MRFSAVLAFLMFVSTAYAQELQVPFYDGVFVADLAQQGHSKLKIFNKMQERLINQSNSICANRAHMWSYDFMRFFQVDSAKVFIFYTPKTSRAGGDNWWYHVAPVVNEKGIFYAMDRSFFDSPVTVNTWLESFNGSTKKCYEIKNEDTDLIVRMFNSTAFPEKTAHGKYSCYYKIVPAGIWFPVGIAYDILNTDQSGSPILFTRNEKIPDNEALSACIEAYERDRSKPDPKKFLEAQRRCELYLKASEPGAVKLPL